MSRVCASLHLTSVNPLPGPCYAVIIVQLLSHVWLLVTPWTLPARLLCPWDFPGKNTGVGCHFLLQGIFLTQGSNPQLLLGRRILYH